MLSNVGYNYPILEMTDDIAVLNNNNGVNIQKDGSNNMFIHDQVDLYSDINSTSNISCVNINADNVYNKEEKEGKRRNRRKNV